MSHYYIYSIQFLPEPAREVCGLSNYTTRNRFRNIFPCETLCTLCVIWLGDGLKYFLYTDDNSRVHLTEIPGEEESDYINASFITVRMSQVKVVHYLFSSLAPGIWW